MWEEEKDKIPYTNVKPNKQSDKTKKPPKCSIKQRLRTDLGWSFGVNTAIQLVWFNQFMGSGPSH